MIIGVNEEKIFNVLSIAFGKCFCDGLIRPFHTELFYFLFNDFDINLSFKWFDGLDVGRQQLCQKILDREERIIQDIKKVEEVKL